MADTQPAKSAYDTAKEQIASFKTKEASLTPAEYTQYLSALDTLNKGPENFTEVQSQKVGEFKTAFIGALSQHIADKDLVAKLADKAAQRFVVERKTGEQSLVDYVAQEGKLDNGIVRKALSGFNPISFIPDGAGAFSNEYARVNTLSQQAKTSAAQGERQKGLDELSATQRGQSGDLFQQALQAFQQPLPTFTPELSQAALAQLQQDIATQGQTALSHNEATFANRGLTGSSIEAFGQGTTQGQIAKAYASSTLDFLLKSGQSGQQNREFLANQLFQQSQSLLGAGQQTNQQGVGYDLGVNEITSRQNQLAAQISQFNQTLSENQRQFNEQQAFQKSQAGENLALLMQQLSQPKKSSFVMPGAALGAGLGALFALPTGGLSLAAGAAIGGGLGAGAGGLGDYFGG